MTMTRHLLLSTIGVGVVLLVAGPAIGQHQDPTQQQQQQPRQPERQPPSGRAQGTQGQARYGDNVMEDILLRRLAERAYVGKDFRLEVQNGVAELRGTVPSAADRNRIIRIAQRTPGITEVKADFQIQPAVREREPAVTDQALAQQVARQIASAISGAKAGEDWWFEGWRVEGPTNVWSLTVEAFNGNVFLDGEVPQLETMRKAIEAALTVQGVRSVSSDLELEYGYAYPAYSPYYPYRPYVHGHPYSGPYPYYGTYDPYAGPPGSPPAASPATGADGEQQQKGGPQQK